jgi:hypothetical protein
MRDRQDAQAQCQKRLARTLFHVSGEEPAFWSSTTVEWLRLWFRCMALSAVAERVRSIGPKAGERTAMGIQLRLSEGSPQLRTGVNRLPPSRLVKASPSSGGVVVDQWRSLYRLPPLPHHCQETAHGGRVVAKSCTLCIEDATGSLYHRSLSYTCSYPRVDHLMVGPGDTILPSKQKLMFVWHALGGLDGWVLTES